MDNLSTHMIKSSDYKEQIFCCGFDYFQSLLSDISQAINSIDLETYIFLQDDLGQRIINALCEAAKRKVQVRLLLDGAGTPNWDVNIAKRLDAAGVQTRIFHPFPWRVWQWSLIKINEPLVQKFIYLLLYVNSRNHRKSCIIDSKIAYIGSFNIRGNYFVDNQSQEIWRDAGIRLQGLELTPLQEAFIAAWDHFPIKKRIQSIFQSVNANSIFRLNNTWHRRHFLYKDLLRKIKFCKNRIWITNAYFVPDNFLLKRLKLAAQRKVDVRILLPKKSDVTFMPWASSAFYQQLLKAGVRIFEYLPDVLHAKTLIIDDCMFLGSSNLNHRSLLHDLEADVNIQLPESKKILEQQFVADLKNAEEIQLGYWQKRPWRQRIIGRLVLYLKYLI